MSSSPGLRPSDRIADEQLRSWKEIAAFLGRDVRTVQRWEKVEGLPVHRHRHSKLDTVYAYKGELLGWQDLRRPSALSPDLPQSPAGLAASSSEPRQKSRGTRYLWPALIFGILLLALLALVLSKKIARHSGLQTGEAAVPLVSFYGEEFSPAFSPDGRKVAFVWNGEQQNNFDIYAKDIYALQPVRLTTSLDTDYSPAWSPDGKWIAFCRGSDKPGGELWVIPAAGGPERRILDLNTVAVPSARALSWSRDSKSLVISLKPASQTKSGLFLVDVLTGSYELLHQDRPGENNISPAMSPDGKTLAFVRDTGRGISSIFLLPFLFPDRMHAEAKRLFWPGLQQHLSIGGPAWTPDSRALVFNSNQGGDAHLWLVPADGKDKPKLLPYGADVQNAAISPQGQLAYQHHLTNMNIWQIDLKSSQSGLSPVRKRVLASTRIQNSPKISPDGTRLVFVSNRAGFEELWTSTTEGTHASPLTALKASTGSPSWSPDGRLIAFDARVLTRPQIFLIPAPGGTPQPLTDGQQTDVVPEFSADGKSIYFSSNRTGEFQIWKMSLTGADQVQITTRGGFAGLFSPDGKYLVYSRQNTPSSSVWRFTLATGREEVLAPAVLNRAFVPSNNGLFYASSGFDRTPSLSYLAFDSNLTRHLLDFDKMIELGFALSGDERYLFYSQLDQSSQDLQLVQEFWR